MQHVVHFVVNFVVQFYLRARDSKFHFVINTKRHFVMIYIFELNIFEYTFSNFYILVCFFPVMFIRKSIEC